MYRWDLYNFYERLENISNRSKNSSSDSFLPSILSLSSLEEQWCKEKTIDCAATFEFFCSKREKRGRGEAENIGPRYIGRASRSWYPSPLFPDRCESPSKKKLLVSPWQIFNSTATWKNRILPMVGSYDDDDLPHPSSGNLCDLRGEQGSALRATLDTRSWEILFRPRS